MVYDPANAVTNVDNEVTRNYGEIGSATASSGVFFCNELRDIVSSLPYSYRDVFQIEDITRGPGMHNDQFDGLTWVSVPLLTIVRVWLMGGSDVACELSELAHHVGFEVHIVDDDKTYIDAGRFPHAHRWVLPSFEEGLPTLPVSSNDYVCVLTRGHMYDPLCCLWATQNNVHYVGMMGSKGKNDRVHTLCMRRGMTEEEWARVKRPIGLKFGAKTPAELAISIVAELSDVRYRPRYTEQAIAEHEADLGL